MICGTPASTAIFKSLIALKTRNPIIFAFHPERARSPRSPPPASCVTAVGHGAPDGAWVTAPSMEATGLLMNHPGVALILATGGNAMVRAAYSCGKPALGVGQATSAYIENHQDKRAVNDVVLSKAIRQRHDLRLRDEAVIIDDEIYDAAMAEFAILHAYRVNKKEKALLEKFISVDAKNCADAKLNPTVVGKSVFAEMSALAVPTGSVNLGQGFPDVDWPGGRCWRRSST